MKTNPVVIEENFDVPAERIWQAITEKNKMKEWYFNLDDFRATPGFTFSFAGKGRKGQDYLHLCKITEVIPNKKLQYSWKYENYPGESFVTFELSEKENKTHLRLTHEGLETFPSENPDFDKSSFEQGWNELIRKQLPAFLEKQL